MAVPVDNSNPNQQIPGSFASIDEPVAITNVPPPSSSSFAPPPQDETGKKRFPLGKIGIIALVGLASLGILGGIFFGASKLLVKKEVNKPVELTWWGLWEEESSVEPLINEYQKTHPNVKIKYIKESPQDYRDRLNTALAKGGTLTPDIFRFHNTWVPMFKNDLAQFPKDLIDEPGFLQTFYPAAGRDLIRGGDILGIPLMFDGLGLYINDEIFEKNNLQVSTNWQDLRATAIALTQKDPQGKILQAGVSLGTVNNVDSWQDILALMFLQNNADLANPSDKRAEDALSFYTIFSTIDKVWDETLPPSTLAFANGKLAMYLGPSWRVFEIKQQNPKLRFHIVPVPQLPKSRPDEPDVTWASFWVEGVWNKSPAKREAFLFLKFLSEKEQLEKLYSNASQARLFGEPPGRRDMREARLSDPYVGAYLMGAETAKSWYLAARTMDGQTGINSRISKYFEDAVNSTRAGKSPQEILRTLSLGVKQVLGDYGVK